MQGSKKQKLTLSVSKDAIVRARKVGLNLSEITEKVLQGFTAVPANTNAAEVYSHYELLFGAMLPMMKQYDLSVQVGAETEFDDDGTPISAEALVLGPNGDMIREQMDNTITRVKLKDIPVGELFDADRILSNFISTLSNAKQRNQEMIGKLQLAKRIIDVMTESVGPRTEKATSLAPSASNPRSKE
jgi:Post-segregation antitoxin CcdA